MKTKLPPAISAKELRERAPAVAGMLADKLSQINQANREKAQFYIQVVDSEEGDSEKFPVTTMNEASVKYRSWTDQMGYGASKAGACLIYKGDKVVGHVSYNGKVWDGLASEWYSGKKPIYDPSENWETVQASTLKVDDIFLRLGMLCKVIFILKTNPPRSAPILKITYVDATTKTNKGGVINLLENFPVEIRRVPEL